MQAALTALTTLVLFDFSAFASAPTETTELLIDGPNKSVRVWRTTYADIRRWDRADHHGQCIISLYHALRRAPHGEIEQALRAATPTLEALMETLTEIAGLERVGDACIDPRERALVDKRDRLMTSIKHTLATL